jgi:hypothetical protein
MSTRRQFVQSALLLPSALATTGLTYAQPPAASQLFADFESGNFDGWTIEGNAFGTRPATDAAFPGKIRGFSGKGYASSFHPSLGNAATGKLISREFTIDKPFLTAKIGGGNHPHQACLNVVVDNKIVASATGNGTPNLSDVSLDLTAHLGKTARLEIVDSTTSNERGYILVDDIQFGNAIKNTGIGWRDRTIEPFFILRTKLWQGIDFRNGESPFPFELSENDIQRAIDAVVVAMRAPDMALPPVDERSVEHIAARIVAKVDATIAALNLPKVNTFTRQWLVAESVCHWVQVNLRYDHPFAEYLGKKGGWGGISPIEMKQKIISSEILSSSRPATVCWGLAVTTRDIARAAKLRCDFTNGNYRGLGNSASKQDERNHSVVSFLFDGGFVVPADVTDVICDYQNNNKRFVNKKTNSWSILPRHSETWELYLATFNSDVGQSMTISDDKQNVHLLLQIPYSDWASRDTTYLKTLLSNYKRWEMQRRSQ